MVKAAKSIIAAILSFVLIGSTCAVFVEQVKAEDSARQLETNWSGQAGFTTEKFYITNQSAKLVIPSNAPYGSNAIVYYSCQKPLNTVGTVQFYTAYTTARPRCMLSLDVDHDGLCDMLLLSDYQATSNGQWKLITGGSQWGWTISTPTLLDYGKSWKSLEEWQAIYGDATVLKAGVGLEYWAVEPDGFDQPLYVDGLVITQVTPKPTPTPTNNIEPVNSTKMLPNLDLNCSSTSSNVNFKVNINGVLTDNETEPLADEPILVSYSLTNGSSWIELTFLKTQEDGTFSAVWLPQATGNFLVRATYPGNDVYQDVNATVSLAVAETGQQTSCFTIYSNSTLSELAFNSANRELSFSVSGKDGTAGYVDAFIPESLVGNTISLNVNLDNKQILYTAKLENDTWIISFNYHHSTHAVSMKMDSTHPSETASESPTTLATQNPASNNSQPDWAFTAFIAVAAATGAVIATALVMKKKNS
ncbi:MAG: hypothetical protein ACQCN5_12610 [Candidatus Bathyarchaeia archaeon]|jgi:hypothetical protein